MSSVPNQPEDSTYARRFAQRLREMRMKTGMTGVEAAAAITQAGFTCKGRTYYGWESGKRQPPIDSLPAIARALGKSSPRTLLPKE